MGVVMEWFGLMIVMLSTTAAAAKYKVGDEYGWNVPRNASFYGQWTSNKTFLVGDSLVFNWTGVHNVLEVTSKAEYDSCTKTNGHLKETSPVTIDLAKNSTLYFLCTVGPHCSLGQKVTIKVGNGMSSAPPSSSAPANSADPPFTINPLVVVVCGIVMHLLLSIPICPYGSI